MSDTESGGWDKEGREVGFRLVVTYQRQDGSTFERVHEMPKGGEELWCSWRKQRFQASDLKWTGTQRFAFEADWYVAPEGATDGTTLAGDGATKRL